MFKVEIETGNDAFQPEPGPEIARILRRLAEDFESWEGDPDTATVWDDNGRIRDVNGATVGRWVLKGD